MGKWLSGVYLTLTCHASISWRLKWLFPFSKIITTSHHSLIKNGVGVNDLAVGKIWLNMNLGAQFTQERIIRTPWIYDSCIRWPQWWWMCVFMLMRDLLPPEGELICFVLTAVLFACCVNVQTKRIIMAESRYDKYEEHWGSFIILTASIVFWPAGTGQSIPVYWNRLKTCLPWLWIRILICFLSHQEVLKELVAVDIEVYYVQRLGWCVHGEIFWNCFDFLHIIYSPVRAIKQLYSSGFHLFF